MRAKLAGLALVSLLALSAAPVFAANSELNVGADGVFSAKNLLIYQTAGSAIYARAVWGQSFVRLTVLVSTSGTTTKLVKEHGGTASMSDLKAGDLIDVVGSLQNGADTLLVNADSVSDHALNTESKDASGIIKSVSGNTFTMTDKKLGAITVEVGSSTITKGVRTISAAELAKGDKVLSVSGAYDYSSQTLSAFGGIAVWQDPSVFKAKTFVGVLKQLPGASLPTSLILSTNNGDYQVFLGSSTKVINRAYGATQLNRFAAGDTVRVYGAIREDNLANIDASIVRDINF